MVADGLLSSRCVGFLVSIVFLLPGCSGTESDPGAEPIELAELSVPVDSSSVVATVSGVPISADELRWQMARAGSHRPGSFETREEKLVVLEDMITTVMMAESARSAGFESSPEMQRAVRRMLADAYRMGQLRARFAAVSVSDESVRQDYDDNIAAYEKSARARGSAILLRYSKNDDEAARSKIMRAAGALRERAAASASNPTAFASLALEHSGDRASRKRGGDMGWLPEGAKTYRWEPEVVSALFELEGIGSLSPLIETEKGVVIVKLTGHVEPQPAEFETVEADIRARLMKAERSKLAEQLMASVKPNFDVVIDYDILDAVGPRAGGGDAVQSPPSFPMEAGL